VERHVIIIKCTALGSNSCLTAHQMPYADRKAGRAIALVVQSKVSSTRETSHVPNARAPAHHKPGDDCKRMQAAMTTAERMHGSSAASPY
jgi:hypothetical protein